MSCLSLNCDRIVGRPRRCPRLAVAVVFLFCLFWATHSICQTQGRTLCNGGDGSFDAEFRTGIRVHVGAAREGDFATRTCAAKLSWEKQELVVATGAAQLDLEHPAWTWEMASQWLLFRSRSPMPNAAWSIRSIPWENRRAYCAPSLEEISTVRPISISWEGRNLDS